MSASEEFHNLHSAIVESQHWKSKLTMCSQTQDGSEIGAVDLCDHMVNPEHLLRRFQVNDTSFRFDTSKHNGENHDAIDALKNDAIASAKADGVKLSPMMTRRTPRGNRLWSISFGCDHSVVIRPKTNQTFNDASFQQVGTHVGVKRHPKNINRCKKKHNPSNDAYKHHVNAH